MPLPNLSGTLPSNQGTTNATTTANTSQSAVTSALPTSIIDQVAAIAVASTMDLVKFQQLCSLNAKDMALMLHNNGISPYLQNTLTASGFNAEYIAKLDLAIKNIPLDQLEIMATPFKNHFKSPADLFNKEKREMFIGDVAKLGVDTGVIITTSVVFGLFGKSTPGLFTSFVPFESYANQFSLSDCTVTFKSKEGGKIVGASPSSSGAIAGYTFSTNPKPGYYQKKETSEYYQYIAPNLKQLDVDSNNIPIMNSIKKPDGTVFDFSINNIDTGTKIYSNQDANGNTTYYGLTKNGVMASMIMDADNKWKYQTTPSAPVFVAFSSNGTVAGYTPSKDGTYYTKNNTNPPEYYMKKAENLLQRIAVDSSTGLPKTVPSSIVTDKGGLAMAQSILEKTKLALPFVLNSSQMNYATGILGTAQAFTTLLQERENGTLGFGDVVNAAFDVSISFMPFIMQAHPELAALIITLNAMRVMFASQTSQSEQDKAKPEQDTTTPEQDTTTPEQDTTTPEQDTTTPTTPAPILQSETGKVSDVSAGSNPLTAASYIDNAIEYFSSIGSDTKSIAPIQSVMDGKPVYFIAAQNDFIAECEKISGMVNIKGVNSSYSGMQQLLKADCKLFVDGKEVGNKDALKASYTKCYNGEPLTADDIANLRSISKLQIQTSDNPVSYKLIMDVKNGAKDMSNTIDIMSNFKDIKDLNDARNVFRTELDKVKYGSTTGISNILASKDPNIEGKLSYNNKVVTDAQIKDMQSAYVALNDGKILTQDQLEALKMMTSLYIQDGSTKHYIMNGKFGSVNIQNYGFVENISAMQNNDKLLEFDSRVSKVYQDALKNTNITQALDNVLNVEQYQGGNPLLDSKFTFESNVNNQWYLSRNQTKSIAPLPWEKDFGHSIFYAQNRLIDGYNQSLALQQIIAKAMMQQQNDLLISKSTTATETEKANASARIAQNQLVISRANTRIKEINQNLPSLPASFDVTKAPYKDHHPNDIKNFQTLQASVGSFTKELAVQNDKYIASDTYKSLNQSATYSNVTYGDIGKNITSLCNIVVKPSEDATKSYDFFSSKSSGIQLQLEKVKKDLANTILLAKSDGSYDFTQSALKDTSIYYKQYCSLIEQAKYYNTLGNSQKTYLSDAQTIKYYQIEGKSYWKVDGKLVEASLDNRGLPKTTMLQTSGEGKPVTLDANGDFTQFGDMKLTKNADGTFNTTDASGKKITFTSKATASDTDICFEGSNGKLYKYDAQAKAVFEATLLDSPHVVVKKDGKAIDIQKDANGKEVVEFEFKLTKVKVDKALRPDGEEQLKVKDEKGNYHDVYTYNAKQYVYDKDKKCMFEINPVSKNGEKLSYIQDGFGVKHIQSVIISNGKVIANAMDNGKVAIYAIPSQTLNITKEAFKVDGQDIYSLNGEQYVVRSDSTMHKIQNVTKDSKTVSIVSPIVSIGFSGAYKTTTKAMTLIVNPALDSSKNQMLDVNGRPLQYLKGSNGKYYTESSGVLLEFDMKDGKPQFYTRSQLLEVQNATKLIVKRDEYNSDVVYDANTKKQYTFDKSKDCWTDAQGKCYRLDKTTDASGVNTLKIVEVQTDTTGKLLYSSYYIPDTEDDSDTSGGNSGGNADNKTIYERVEKNIVDSQVVREGLLKDVVNNPSVDNMQKIALDLVFLQEQKQDIVDSIKNNIGQLSNPNLSDGEIKTIQKNIQDAQTTLDKIAVQEVNINAAIDKIDPKVLNAEQTDALDKINKNGVDELMTNEKFKSDAIEPTLNFINSLLDNKENARDQLHKLDAIYEIVQKMPRYANEKFRIEINDASTIKTSNTQSAQSTGGRSI